MSGIFEAAMVIARRDFVATVFSKTFVLFLMAPVFVLGFGVLTGHLSSNDVRAQQPSVAVIADPATALAVQSAHARLSGPFGDAGLPRLQVLDQEDDTAAQARALLGDGRKNVSAVLTGTLDHPRLIGPNPSLDRVGAKMALVIENARNTAALARAGGAPPPISLDRVTVRQSASSLTVVRFGLAQAGQGLIFFLTIVLATMLLSNLVEEKSNKVIEVLAAAVPIDAIFFGKLLAMLGVSMVGILIWGSMAAGALFLVQSALDLTITPAVGWPAFVLLVTLYFMANYMLLGAVFLGIGGQASNVREVQTLSMPITFAQLAIFFLATASVSDDYGSVTWFATIFPLSSPLAMIGVAAKSSAVWPHLAALVWQAFWIWLIVRVFAYFFRRTVMKSRGGGILPRFRRKPA